MYVKARVFVNLFEKALGSLGANCAIQLLRKKDIEKRAIACKISPVSLFNGLCVFFLHGNPSLTEIDKNKNDPGELDPLTLYIKRDGLWDLYITIRL